MKEKIPVYLFQSDGDKIHVHYDTETDLIKLPVFGYGVEADRAIRMKDDATFIKIRNLEEVDRSCGRLKSKIHDIEYLKRQKNVCSQTMFLLKNVIL